MGDLPSTLADIIALMVAGSSWVNLFFENSQGIGAVRKSETTSKYKAFNDLTFHAPFLSAVRQNVPPQDVRDIFIQSARRNLKSVAHCEQSVHPICWLAELEGKSTIRMTLEEVYKFELPDLLLVTSCTVMSHPHDEVEDCHKAANGTRITSEYDVVETNIVVEFAWQAVKGDCGKISVSIMKASRSLPFGSTRHSPSL